MKKIKCYFRDGFYIPEILLQKYSDFFEREQKYNHADVIFEKYIPQSGVTQAPKDKTIYIFVRGRELKRDKTTWRTIDITDKHFIENYPKFEGITFCRYEVHPQKNMIRVPLNHMPHDRISKDKDYFREVGIDQTDQFFNRCLWRGSWTHIVRRKIVSFLKEKNDTRLDLEFWQAKTGRTYGLRGSKAPDSWEYDQYFEELQKSDAALCIRGDTEWLYSFWDIIRAGAIPVLVNTGYQHLGWDKIGIDYKDLFLSYDISSEDSTLDVYNGINDLLNDKERCKKMKMNLRKFYQEIYLTDRGLDLHLLNEDHPITPKYPGLCGWGDFFAGKVIEIVKNNFVLKDNFFLSKDGLEIKNKQIH
jgi:hypothetical protein